MNCNQCESTNLFKTRYYRGAQFAIDSSKGNFLTKEGIYPDIYICEDCKNIMFIIPEENFRNVYREED